LSWGGLFGGLLQAAFGVLLFRHPQAVLRYVGRFDPTRAA